MAGTTSQGSPIGEKGTRWAKNRPINGPMQIVGRGGRVASHRNEENGGGGTHPVDIYQVGGILMWISSIRQKPGEINGSNAARQCTAATINANFVYTTQK